MTKTTNPAPLSGLDGRSAVVTGATRGVGLAVARKLCLSGTDVLLNYAHDDTAAREAARALDGLPGNAVLAKGDVADTAALQKVLDQAEERFGGLDIFVHNTAFFRPSAALDVTPVSVERALSVALRPMLSAAPRLAKLMAGRSGRIIALSSIGARRVVPRYVGAGMAKAALEALVRYLAVELAGSGTTVNAISTAKIDKGDGAVPPEVLKAFALRTPAGRLTTPDDVAGVVALLCTPEAAWIQGQTITADGGFELPAA
ncbi:SDR family oxidoreductase [Micromonospora sp. NPDC048830]|uniref:SDR family oxidoreductase n=1 Tax=Micromonospora sp. NPDC048830 TaxID=3364257 RepID=UPI0037108CED